MNPLAIRKTIPIAAVLLAAPFAVAACDDEPSIETEGSVVGNDFYEEEYGLYEPEEFQELDSAAALGRTVTVSANVTRILESGKAFVTGNDAVENDLLVIATPKVKDVPPLAAGDDVLVVGKVIQFVSTDLESAYEPFDLDNDLYGDYDDDHAILAQSIMKVPAVNS